MSAVVEGDGFLLTLPSSMSPINLVAAEDLGVFAPATTDRSSAQDNSTSSSTRVGDRLDACSANSYAYEDFTQAGWVRAGFVALYAVIVVMSVIGNFMVIWTIARNRHMRTVTNYYILNLAVADFLVALVVMPLKLIEYTAPCQWHVFSRHHALCPMLYYILPVFVFTSVLTLAAIVDWDVKDYYIGLHTHSLTLAAISVERSVTSRVPLSAYSFIHSFQWRRYRGFRRFNEPGPPSSWGPRAPSHKNFMQENNNKGQSA